MPDVSVSVPARGEFVHVLRSVIASVAARYRLHDLTIEEPEIETIVRRIYEEGLSPSVHEAAV